MYTATGRINKESNTTVHEYMPLVHKIAHLLVAKLSSAVDVQDLIQAGMIGLMDAASRYETKDNAQFSTYAASRIRGAMIDELRANDWVPRNVRKDQSKLDSAMRKASQIAGRSATDAQVAAVLGLEIDEYQKFLFNARGSSILFAGGLSGSDDDEDYSLLENEADESRDANPTARMTEIQFRRAVVQAIEDLPTREKMLMSLHYEHEMNFREISTILGVNETRVSQMHTSAISRVRVALQSEDQFGNEMTSAEEDNEA